MLRKSESYLRIGRQNRLMLSDKRCLGLVHWDDPEGWYGEGGGRRVQDGEHMYTCGVFFIFKFLELN